MWIAAFNRKDAHHVQGKTIVSAIANGKLPEAVINDYIFNEVLTYIRKKLGPETSLKVANALLNSSQCQDPEH